MNTKLNTSLALVSVAACLAVAGCASPKIESRVQAQNQEAIDNSRPAVSGAGVGKGAGPLVAGGSADADRRAAEQAAQVVLRRAAKPWVASVSIPMGSGEKLPSVFQEQVRLNFSDARSGGKVSLRTVAERITTATGVPVRIKPDVFGGAGASSSAAPMGASGAAPIPLPSLPSGGAPGQGGPMPSVSAGPAMGPGMGFSAKDPSLDAVSMRWSGSLEGYLNHVTDLTNLSWEYRDGVVVIERFRTEFFEIATLDSETSYSMGMNASDQGSTGAGSGGAEAEVGAGSSSSNANVDVSEKGKSNTVSTVLATIQQIIKDVQGSSVIRSDGSGRIAVTTTKETMTKVRDFVRAENESLLRQAQVQFDIYSVRTSAANERGVQWDALLQSLSDGVSLSYATPKIEKETANRIGFSVLKPGSRADRFGNSKGILQLLSQFGTATQHRPISLLTLNRQWARKASLDSKAYVSETVPAAASITGTSGGTGLKTATVTTGDRYLAQPFIMDNNTVVLKFGIGLSSLINLAPFTSAGQTIQRPETTNIIDQSTIALKTGEVLVITGMSRIVTSENTDTLTEDSPVGIGGAKAVSREREDFIIFVRPTIL